MQALKDEKTIEAENRIENLDEFLTVAIEFDEQCWKYTSRILRRNYTI